MEDVGQGVDGEATETACSVERFVRWRVLRPLPSLPKQMIGVSVRAPGQSRKDRNTHPSRHELCLPEVQEESERTSNEVQVMSVEDETVSRLVNDLRQGGFVRQLPHKRSEQWQSERRTNLLRQARHLGQRRCLLAEDLTDECRPELANTRVVYVSC